MQAGDIPRFDAMTLARWLSEYVKGHQRELVQSLPLKTQLRLKGIENERQRARVLMMEVARSDVAMPAPTSEEMGQLQQSLSQNAYRQLSRQVDFSTPEIAVRQLVNILGDTLMRRMDRIVNPERLLKFYDEELTSQQRDRLDSMPPDQAQRELRQQFFMKHLSRRGKNGFGRSQGGPPNRRRRPGNPAPGD